MIGIARHEQGVFQCPAYTVDSAFGSTEHIVVGIGFCGGVVGFIPPHASRTAGFFQFAKGCNHTSFANQFINIEIATRARKRHGYVAIMVDHALISNAPFAC